MCVGERIRRDIRARLEKFQRAVLGIIGEIIVMAGSQQALAGKAVEIHRRQIGVDAGQGHFISLGTASGENGGRDG
jgi:hypothetical protein